MSTMKNQLCVLANDRIFSYVTKRSEKEMMVRSEQESLQGMIHLAYKICKAE